MNTFNKIKTLLLLVFTAVGVHIVKHAETATPVVAEETVTIYLKTNENWRSDGAQFAAYAWHEADGSSYKWYALAPLTPDADEQFFSADIHLTYDKIIFTRMNDTADPLAYGWADLWNQSTDLDFDLSEGDNLYVINEGAWGRDKDGGNDGEVIGYWSTYLPTVIDPDPDPDPDTSENEGPSDIEASLYTIYYYRNDGRAALYDLWLWDAGISGKSYPFTKKETIGKNEWQKLEVASTYFTDKQFLNLIIRRGNWLEQTPDMKIRVTNFPVEDGRRNFFLVDMETTVYPSAEEALGPKLLDARFVIESGLKPTGISVRTYFEPDQYTFLINDEVSKSAKAVAGKNGDFYTFTIPLDNQFDLDIRNNYVVRTTFINTAEYQDIVRERPVGYDAIFNSAYFEDNFTYDGDDLGVTYTPTQTTFKVWAPTSRSIKVNIYEYGTPKSVSKYFGYDEIEEQITLEYTAKGVWEKTVFGDYHEKYYTLVADNANGVEEFTDPYAKAAGVNGIRGMIVDFSKTNPDGWDDVTLSLKKPTEIVPYELHVSDLTADATWNGDAKRRRKFLGLIQEGTMYRDEKTGKALKTGFDHIVELGVNAVQILPFYDQDNDETKNLFNWGYNPQNYNVLEGMYSSNPHNGLARIYEFKQVVQKFAEHDIRIIMDVVYNHVASISQHSFTKLVPGYYFRYYEDGSPNNSSGVGNVTASERLMMANFMRDSTAFWTEEYKLGGFRFDLMGLHTTDSMNKVANKLKTIREDIVIYGEPWDMHDHAGLPDLGDFATQGNIHKLNGVGAFNDQGRDAIKGGSWDTDARVGWVQQNGHEVNKIIDGTMGKITGGTNNPSQVVNYVSVHDNYTIYDHLQVANRRHKNNVFSLAQIKKQALQAEAVSLLSQGVGFMHAGSEILRSKPEGASGNFYHNSYKEHHSYNSIKWNEKGDNLAVYNAYRQMVALKRFAPAFNYETRALVDAHSGASKYNNLNNIIRLTYSDAADNYEIYHYGDASGNATVSGINNMEVVLDTSGAKSFGDKVNGSMSLSPNTSVVLRNVRARTNDPLQIAPTNYETFVEPPAVDDIEWETKVPPGGVLPPDPPETETELDPPPFIDFLPVILIASGSGLAVVGIGVGLFFFIRKRRRRNIT